MSRIHFFAISERWISAPNNDAFCAEKIGDYHLFGVPQVCPTSLAWTPPAALPSQA